jgi:ubiquinone/menaquinone biosynthesis C-methylase UbiE
VDPNDSWEKVATWYDEHLRGIRTYHREVLAKEVVRLLHPFPRGPLLDIGCGEGFFTRLLFQEGWRPAVGIDLSPTLIRKAREKGPKEIRYLVGDGENLRPIGGKFSSAIAILTVQNMAHPEKMFQELFPLLQEGAPFLIVTLHPAFRFPRQSGWGYDREKGIIFRRMDRYMTPLKVPITMHPGKKNSPVTYTYHRPLSFYFENLAKGGFLVDAFVELCSQKKSTGPRAKIENRARQEFPLFVAIRARKITLPSGKGNKE